MPLSLHSSAKITTTLEKNISKMISRRFNIDVDSLCLLHIPLEDIQSSQRPNNQDVILLYNKNSSSSLANNISINDTIAIITTCKVNIDTLKKYINIAEMQKCSCLIIVYKNDITYISKKKCTTLNHLTVEFFHFNELSYDIFEHSLVPIYSLASLDEINALKVNFNLNIPLMRKSRDPICKYMNYPKNTILRIVDKETREISYRKVI